MELVTGDNKKKFETWYIDVFLKMKNVKNKSDHIGGLLGEFNCYYFEKKIGVLLAYYDSLEIHIGFSYEIGYEWEINYKANYIYEDDFKTRNESYIQAFISANNLINGK